MPRNNKARSPNLSQAALSSVDRPGWHVPIGLVLVLLMVVLVYRPALNGGLLLDDDSHITKPELQSIGGLYRIWFEVGATYQYYPLLHSAFWFEHKLWNDSVLGYHAVTLLWHMLAVSLVYFILVRLKIPGAAGSGDLCLAPGDGRVGGLDERAEEHALGRVLPQRDAGLSQIRRVAPRVLLFRSPGAVCAGTVDEDRHNRDVAGRALSDLLVAARRLVVEAGCETAGAVLGAGCDGRLRDGLGGAEADRRRRGRLRIDITRSAVSWRAASSGFTWASWCGRSTSFFSTHGGTSIRGSGGNGSFRSPRWALSSGCGPCGEGGAVRWRLGCCLSAHSYRCSAF